LLRELHIENFALIQDLTVMFGDGLNILTGETGAGKSIIIDALNQVLGDRASAEMVRTGDTKAVISAVLEVNEQAAQRLRELGLGDQEDTVILQREIYNTGKSQARINGRPVNVSVMKELGSLLVEIHGQHEHQALLDESSHLDLVDAFGGQEVLAVREEYRQVWTELNRYQQELAGLHGDQRERERLLDLLQYQVDEIEAAALREDEEEQLAAEHKLLLNARKLVEICRHSYHALYEQDDGGSVVEIIARITNELNAFRDLDTALEQSCTQLEESLYALEDVARQLRNFAEAFAFNPQRLAEVEQRLDLINNLKRKYADTIPGILAWQREKMAEIEAIKNSEARHAQLLQLIDEARARAGQLAEKLSILRQKAGAELAAAIEAELAYLHMPNTRFQVDNSFSEDEQGLPVGGKLLKAHGAGVDNMRFLLSPNPGEPLKPLSRIASGGELSRIMLAILNVLARLRPAATMVFDEIDAGIGGRAAQAVAEKLASVSERCQVICVSHLPQITSMADNHLYIYKEVEGGRTVTRVVRLDMEGRVRELARMLGGAEVTDATLRHAREMLSLASKIKI